MIQLQKIRENFVVGEIRREVVSYSNGYIEAGVTIRKPLWTHVVKFR